jgi:signal transduction histidine kinase
MTRDMLWAALREEKRTRPSSNGGPEPATNPSGIEIDGLHRNGKKFPCRVHACNVEDERGELRYVILTCEDISERRRLEQDLVENQKQLALLDLLGGMGDILNNKLAGIQGYLDLLKNALTKSVARREDSGQITPVNPLEVINWAHGSAGEMTAILRQLVEFGTYLARVQAAPLDLRELLHALAQRWNKFLVLKLPEIPAPLWINAVPKVKAGLDEALRNSREAEATEVVVHLEQMDDQSRVRLILTDNGRGVSPELISKVFLPFFKTKATAHPGLGLWKLRQLVQQSGGAVEINFVPRGGTQLVIVLSLATPEQISKQLEEKPQLDAD